MSSSSSSLMGEISLHPWQSHSGHVYSGSTIGSEIDPSNTLPHMQPNMTVPMINTAYPDVAGNGGFGSMTVAGSSNAEIFLGDYGQSTPAIGFGAEHVTYSASPSSSSDASDEVRRLRQRIHELERELNQSRSTIENLRNTMASSDLPIASSSQTASFQSPSWHAHTEARKQIFCSLNRAGNALCAWHDPHRKCRAYPPRNAPPGHLNCCTYEEALFEESPAHHGVASYLPGNMVHMDPALHKY